MKSVLLLSCALLLTACNTYGPQYAQGQQGQPVGSQNQYIPVFISDDNDSSVAPATSLCTREPYTTYSNSPGYCGYAPIIQP